MRVTKKTENNFNNKRGFLLVLDELDRQTLENGRKIYGEANDCVISESGYLEGIISGALVEILNLGKCRRVDA